MIEHCSVSRVSYRLDRADHRLRRHRRLRRQRRCGTPSASSPPTGPSSISVDLSQITWINGSALRHVAATRRWMSDLLGVDVDLVEWSAAVLQMSTRARLDGVLGRVA